jgi:predicted nucleic acid-binding protein
MVVEINSYVLDSYAVIGYLEDEPFANWLKQLLLSARKGKCRLYLHAIQLGEVYYIILREQGKPIADLAYARIKDFPITIIDTINEKLLLSAASLKANFPMSYADTFAAALARMHSAVLLTGDPEFKALEEKKLLAVKWLSRI